MTPRLSPVAVSGAALVTARGLDARPSTAADADRGDPSFWQSLCSGAEPTPLDEPKIRKGVPTPPAHARLVPFRLAIEKAIPRAALRKISDHSRLVTVAADMALRAAGSDEDARDDLGALLGTCFGSARDHFDYHEGLRRKGITGASALLFTQSVFNAASGHIGHVFGLRGSNLAFVGGESVGLQAISRAALRVGLGSDGALLAGGCDQYDDVVHASLLASGLIADGLCGGVMTEGASLVLLERAGAVQARGGSELAHIRGTAHVRGPDGVADRFARAAAEACRTADVGFADLDLVVVAPPASSVALEHIAAVAALPIDAPLSLPTRGLGEGFAFASSAAATVAVLAVCDGVIPPTTTLDGPRPAWAERTVATATSQPVRAALVMASTTCGAVECMVVTEAQ